MRLWEGQELGREAAHSHGTNKVMSKQAATTPRELFARENQQQEGQRVVVEEDVQGAVTISPALPWIPHRKKKKMRTLQEQRSTAELLHHRGRQSQGVRCQSIPTQVSTCINEHVEEVRARVDVAAQRQVAYDTRPRNNITQGRADRRPTEVL